MGRVPYVELRIERRDESKRACGANQTFDTHLCLKVSKLYSFPFSSNSQFPIPQFHFPSWLPSLMGFVIKDIDHS